MGEINCKVTNANYDRVLAIMNKMMAERYKDVCSCERCMSDVVALALNYLPPHYVVESEPGREFGSPWVMVETAVNEAFDRVMEHPNHPHAAPPTGKQAGVPRSGSFLG